MLNKTPVSQRSTAYLVRVGGPEQLPIRLSASRHTLNVPLGEFVDLETHLLFNESDQGLHFVISKVNGTLEDVSSTRGICRLINPQDVDWMKWPPNTFWLQAGKQKIMVVLSAKMKQRFLNLATRYAVPIRGQLMLDNGVITLIHTTVYPF